MKTLAYVLVIATVAVMTSCQPDKNVNEETTDVLSEESTVVEEIGFNLADSDQQAIEIADMVMEAMGGQQAWDSLRYISWNFFGARDLIWDKQTGRVRIDFPRDSSIFLVNINTMEGKVMRKGLEVVDSVQKDINIAKSIWINDSYWLAMPFKLKDPGVTLTYAREDTTLSGTSADVLTLHFEGVGVTPDNKYEVYVDKSDHLIKQWSYFKDAEQDSVSAIWPWDNYSEYNGVLLSGDRSDNKGPKSIKVFNDLPNSVFESFEQPAL